MERLKILITGSSGGMGTAIKQRLKAHDLTCIAHADILPHFRDDFDWMICAHGVIDEDDAEETFMANVIKNIWLTETLNPKNIIFISSTAGIKGNDKYPVYSASKAALNMYCKSISTKRNCYALCPGPTDTPMFKKLGIKDVKPQSPDEVAKAIEMIMAGNFKSGDIVTIKNGIMNV